MPDKWQIVVVPCLIALRTLKGGWDSLLDDTTLLLLIFQLVSWCLYPALRVLIPDISNVWFVMLLSLSSFTSSCRVKRILVLETW